MAAVPGTALEAAAADAPAAPAPVTQAPADGMAAAGASSIGVPTAAAASPEAGAPAWAAAAGSRPGGPSRGLVVAVATLVTLLLAAAVALSIAYERSRRQDELQHGLEITAATIRARLGDTETGLQLLAAEMRAGRRDGLLEPAAQALLTADPALLRIEHRSADGRPIVGFDAPAPRPSLGPERRRIPGFETALALAGAQGFGRLIYSRSYFLPLTPDHGFEVMDLVVPIGNATARDAAGVLVATYSMPRLLTLLGPAEFLRANQLWATEADGTFIARASGASSTRGAYNAVTPLELPGNAVLLKSNSVRGGPQLIPNLLTGLLILVTVALGASGLLLWRDVRLRLAAERELRTQHAFRKAMEDSLVTGLRARDMHGRITYVNPAFCEMTGYRADELIGLGPPMPYWAPEQREQYEHRYARLLAGAVNRQGFETVFMRRNGERFPVLIFEAPLIDGQGRQTGWMSSVLDVGERRRIEDLSRRQQEKLQSNARMAMLGEVATALSHELNQPLAAIASYAAACENLLAPEHAPASLQGALRGIRAQAERAGQVIRSVQSFMRRRDVTLEPVRVSALIQSVQPLIELQARKVGGRVRWKATDDAVVIGDPVLLEQVLLNLTRNGFESMAGAAPEHRLLEIDARRDGAQVEVVVADRGGGVDPALVPQLFNPFVSTKPDGLGIGLSLCRSVVERLGGRLGYLPRDGGGSLFHFGLPAAPA